MIDQVTARFIRRIIISLLLGGLVLLGTALATFVPLKRRVSHGES